MPRDRTESCLQAMLRIPLDDNNTRDTPDALLELSVEVLKDPVLLKRFC